VAAEVRFEQLEHRHWPPRDHSTPEATEKAIQQSRAQIKYEHDFAQDGPTFDKLKRTHPHTGDAQLKAAIIAAVKFDDDCFSYLAKECKILGRRLLGKRDPRGRAGGAGSSGLSGDYLSRCKEPGRLLHEITRVAPVRLMPFEVLHVALVLFGGGARFEGAEIAAFAGFRIELAGIEPVFA
jgi:hypothetical protein